MMISDKRIEELRGILRTQGRDVTTDEARAYGERLLRFYRTVLEVPAPLLFDVNPKQVQN